MVMQNPFPGMNPFFELQWRDAHTRLITHMAETLQELLPADLVARAEEKVLAIGESNSGRTKTYRPDLQVREPWMLKEPGASTLESTTSPPPVPICVLVDEETERWIEIQDLQGRLVTVIELLSPSNKLELSERDQYRQKRHTFINSGVNLVEIDLVRQEHCLFPEQVCKILSQAGASYGICVFRATRPATHEVYPIRLRDRVPSIRIPLRAADADVVLDLQPLIDRCHERGRYHLLNYRLTLDPPLSPEDAGWAADILKARGLL